MTMNDDNKNLSVGFALTNVYKKSFQKFCWPKFKFKIEMDHNQVKKKKNIVACLFCRNHNWRKIVKKKVYTLCKFFFYWSSYLKDDQRVFHAEIVGRQTFALPDELFTLCAEETPQVKRADPDTLHPTLQTLLPDILHKRQEMLAWKLPTLLTDPWN